jgi:hypothetical protein
MAYELIDLIKSRKTNWKESNGKVENEDFKKLYLESNYKKNRFE